MTRKWYQKKRYIIPSLIFFPPLGIPLAWLTNWHRNVKIAATVASTLFLIVVLATPPEETGTTQSSTTDSVDTQEDSSLPEREIEDSVEPYLDITKLIGQSMTELAQRFNVTLNQSNNLSYENEKYQLLIETRDGQTSSYVTLGVKELGLCQTDNVLDRVDRVFLRAGLDPSVKGSPTNPQDGIDLGFVEYGNYLGIYQIGASCLDGGYYEANIRLKK